MEIDENYYLDNNFVKKEVSPTKVPGGGNNNNNHAPSSPTRGEHVLPNSSIWVPNEKEGYVACVAGGEGFTKGRAGMVKLVMVTNSDTEEFEIGGEVSKRVERREKLSEEEVLQMDDMARMNEMHNASLLHALRIRYASDSIYTNVGRTVLISVNPLKDLSEKYYTNEVKQKYFDAEEEIAIVGDRKEEITPTAMSNTPPHVYQIAATVFNVASTTPNTRQSIIFSGESGAGKTEATKIFLNYLAFAAAQQQQQKASSSLDVLSSTNKVRERLLEANPLIESFGNSKTIRNDNSSRFGSWVELEMEANKIQSATLSSYLLEKSRVVFHARNERSFHVFYQIVSSFGFPLKANNKFIQKSEVDEKADREGWQRTLKSLKAMNIQHEKCVQLLMGILELGQIEIESQEKHKETGEEFSTIKGDISQCCLLLGYSEEELRSALTQKNMSNVKEEIFKPTNKIQAEEFRDALGKHIYEQIFEWLVASVNKSMKGEQKQAATSKTATIGILDCFGFEVLSNNSFEQLCINYCNERIMSHFNEVCIHQEKALFERENLLREAGQINFYSNEKVIRMIEGGLFQQISDEIKIPKGSDETLLRKFREKLDKNECFLPYISQLKDVNAKSLFGVKHFAGSVFYNINGFIEKNKDALPSQLENLCEISISQLPEQSESEPVVVKALVERSASARSHQKLTLGTRFCNSLNELMKNKILNTDTFFVRCLKPNDVCKPDFFNGSLVLTQLRYGGVLEACKIRKNAFPVRKTNVDFLSKFSIFAPEIAKNEGVVGLCNYLRGKYFQDDADGLLNGETQVFLKSSHFSTLEKHLQAFTNENAKKIQKMIRGRIERRNFTSKKNRMMQLNAAIAKLDDVKIDQVLGEMGNDLDYHKEVKAAYQLSSDIKEEKNMAQELVFILEKCKNAYTKAMKQNLVGAVEACRGMGHDYKGGLKQLLERAEGEIARMTAVERALGFFEGKEDLDSSKMKVVNRHFRAIGNVLLSKKDEKIAENAHRMRLKKAGRLVLPLLRANYEGALRREGYFALEAAVKKQDLVEMRRILKENRLSGPGRVKSKKFTVLIEEAKSQIRAYEALGLQLTLELERATKEGRRKLALGPQGGDWHALHRVIGHCESKKNECVPKAMLEEAKEVLQQIAAKVAADNEKKKPKWWMMMCCSSSSANVEVPQNPTQEYRELD